MNSPVWLEETQVVLVGTFGKSVGLHGGVRFFLLTDFPEILQRDTRFFLEYHKSVQFLAVSPKSQMPHRVGGDSISSESGKSQKLPLCNTLNETQSVEQISCSAKSELVAYIPILLHSYNEGTQVMRLQGITTRTHSDYLRNLSLYSTIEDTRKLCNLNKDEFFYFDIIGMSVVEEEEIIGVVQDIQEIANTYYFVLETHFLIPYIDYYVRYVDLESRRVFTNNARFLKNSL